MAEHLASATVDKVHHSAHSTAVSVFSMIYIFADAIFTI